VRHDAQHLLLGLAHAHAADRIAGEIQCHQLFQRLLAQVLETCRLARCRTARWGSPGGQTRPAQRGPAQAQLHRVARLSVRWSTAPWSWARPRCRACIRRTASRCRSSAKVWICIEISGVRNSSVAVDRGRKTHTFLADLAHGTERPDLEPARVGEDGFAPLSKACSPPNWVTTSKPGRIHRWKVLPRMIWAPMSSRLCGVTPLTVP
jgi:hypothetical protein